LAGAGVSVPSNLPRFGGLALRIYQRLGDSLHQVIKNIGVADEAVRKVILKKTQLSPQQRVEIDFFL
jgi:hypothetical protein